MSNHDHLLLETPEANLVAGMRWLQGAYTQRYNSRHKLRGNLFQGRLVAVGERTVGDAPLYTGDASDQPEEAASWAKA